MYIYMYVYILYSYICIYVMCIYIYHKVYDMYIYILCVWIVWMFSLVSFGCVPRLQGDHLRPPGLAQLSGLCPGTALQKRTMSTASTIFVSMWSIVP